MTVVDMHMHLLTQSWVDQIKKYGPPDFSVGQRSDGTDCLIEGGTMTMTLERKKFDFDLHVKAMDEHRIDVGVLSLTSPNVFWGAPEVSAETARLANDGMRAAETAHPGRFRWMAAIPWQHPELALAELDRALQAGAVGVVALANVRGKHLTDPLFAPVWAEIDRRALPVFVHPSNPPGHEALQLGTGLTRAILPTVGFTFDTTLAFARLVFDGFFDRYPGVKLIAAHGGGALPYLAGRIELFYGSLPEREQVLAHKPGEYLERIYYDAILYKSEVVPRVRQHGRGGPGAVRHRLSAPDRHPGNPGERPRAGRPRDGGRARRQRGEAVQAVGSRPAPGVDFRRGRQARVGIEPCRYSAISCGRSAPCRRTSAGHGPTSWACCRSG